MWSHSPPDPVPIGDEPAPRIGPQAKPEPGPARPSRLLPVVQCLAEGGWLAVVAAALQALSAEPPIVGPLELAIVAGIGMAWARRQRWRTPAWEAFGLPAIAVAAGTLGWLLAPEVRIALVEGNLQAALTTHPGGWVAAAAVYRGHVHTDRERDEEVQDTLIRWGLPFLAGAWLIGDLAARTNGPILHDAFTAMAFIGSILFITAAVLALGLARLAAVRGDGPGGGSWFGFALVVALGMTVIGLPAAVLLGVPLEALVVAAIAPIRIAGALLILVLSPVVLVAAFIADLARAFLPEGFGLGTLELPEIAVGPTTATSPLPGILFYAIVAGIILLELAAVALYLWWRWRERQEVATLLSDVHEERSVVYDRTPRPPKPPSPAAAPRRDRRDPVAAYLLALDALAADGRWDRRASETPRHHVDRLAVDAPDAVRAGLGRLAAAYQLARYAGHPLSVRERSRTAARLDRLERVLRTPR